MIGSPGDERLRDRGLLKEKRGRSSQAALALLAVGLVLGGGGLALVVFAVLTGSPLGSAFGIASDSVKLVTIHVNIQFDEVGDGPEVLALDPIGLPHCSMVGFDNSTNRVTIRAGDYDRAISTVVLIYYTSGATFSGGGDSSQALFLRDGEIGTVVAAWNRSTALYRVNPSNRDLLEPVAAARPERDLLLASYQVNFTQGVWGGPRVGTYQVEETHAWVQHEDVPVFVRSPGMCM
jgi:hypothetical protein